MAEATQNKFNFKSRVIVPTVFPYMIEGEDAEAIFGEICGVIDSEFKGNPRLKVLELTWDKVVFGTSPLILPVVNRVLSPDFRVIRPEKLEKTLQEGDPLNMKNNSIDYGIVLDFSGNNSDLARLFYAQLPNELRDLDRLPAVVLGYGLANSESGDYGVCPTFIDGTELRISKVLVGDKGHFYPNDPELTRIGLPSKVGRGENLTRKFSPAKQNEPSINNLGLSRLYLSSKWYLSSGDKDLALPLFDGLVVLESTSAVAA